MSEQIQLSNLELSIANPIISTIDVVVQGGTIQKILGIPKGIEIRVIDYDTGGTPSDELSISPLDHEEFCLLQTWKFGEK